MVAACAGISGDTKESAEKLPGQISAASATVTKAQQQFNQTLQRPNATFMKAYQADVERGGFREAAALVAGADKLYSGQLKPVLDRNEEADNARANQLVADINRRLKQAQELSKLPGLRATEVIKAKDNATALTTTAKANVAELDRTTNELGQTVQAAAAKYPQQAGAINKRLVPIQQQRQTADRELTRLEAGLKTDPPNYATLYDTSSTITATHQAAMPTAGKLRTQLADVDNTVTRTLVDMKIDCTVTVTRSSWDESSDGGESTHTYRRDLPGNTEACLYWEGLSDKLDDDAQIGEYEDPWNGDPRFKLAGGVDRKRWDQLSLDFRQDWPGSHNSATYHLEAVDLQYFHKVNTTRNGVMTQGDWQPVSAEVFDDREYDLGMDIYTKPAGTFDDEASDEASPPGMAYIGNPDYGQWRNDSSGSSFWVFYGQYRFFSDLLGGSVYRSDYNDYNRRYYGRGGYYGSMGDRDRWGTLSPQTRSRYTTTNWVRTGGQEASIRTAGPSGRAGGPGGGGK
jgi:hypothetical protein